MDIIQLQPGENTTPVDPPQNWEPCLSDKPLDIMRYNAIVKQWESWAKYDPEEKEANWKGLTHYTGTVDPTTAQRLVDSQFIAQAIHATKYLRCWGHVVLACTAWSKEELRGNRTGWRLQNWYPKSDITMLQYNTNGPVVQLDQPTYSKLKRPSVVRDDVPRAESPTSEASNALGDYDTLGYFSTLTSLMTQLNPGLPMASSLQQTSTPQQSIMPQEGPILQQDSTSEVHGFTENIMPPENIMP
jgi:hypothetical protein